ncbi:YEATS family protein [Leishmania donovani]|uniref:YEATS family protein n=1 Tax=Leishmania donovani TaxID=5661 RepID=A0A504Y3T5_LEIDO|nr:YEATS family protein [Leishmania donovani]
MSTAAGEKPPRRTRRSVKEALAEAATEEVKPRRGGRRRRADAESEELKGQQRASASYKLKGRSSAVTVASVDDVTGTLSGSDRRGGWRRGSGDAVTKRSRSPSPPSQSSGNSSTTTTAAAATPLFTVPAVIVTAVDGTGGGCATPLSPGALTALASGAATNAATTMGTYGGSGAGGGTAGTRAHQAHSTAAAAPLEDPSARPMRPRYVWNGGDRYQQHSLPSAASSSPANDVQLGGRGVRTIFSEAWATLSSCLSSTTERQGASSTASVSPTMVDPSHTTSASQLYMQAQRIVSSWRAEQHRTPSMLLSHPYSPLLMPGLRVYQHPLPLLASTPASLAAPADANAATPSTDRLSAVKAEADDEESGAGSRHRRHHRCGAAPHTTSVAAAGPGAECGSSRVYCYPNQTLIVPVVVGGCVQLVNPESKDKSHQWTVYVRGLWNGHPEEVAGANVRPPSSSHASVFSASTASPDDYLSDFIDKVVFVLDESFVPCVRTVSSAPFELTEVGWGEFIVSMHVYLKVPVHTSASRRAQGQLLEYYCGFNGRTAMQTCDGRGTKPHDPVSTYVTGGVRGPRHLWNALTTPPPSTSGTVPPTPALSLHELRHECHYDSLLDINSNSGARATYYRGPYLPVHLVTCDATSSSASSQPSSSSSDSDADGGGGSDGARGRSGSEVSICGGSPTDSAHALSFPTKSEMSGDGSFSSSRSGSVTPSPAPAPQHHASLSSQQHEARMGGSNTAHTSSGCIADGQPLAGIAAGVADASSPHARPPPLPVPTVGRGTGRRPRGFGASRARSGTPRSPANAGAPGAAGGGGVHRTFTEVHVGHGGNVVVLQHLLRFSHRPRYAAAIPPARDPRTQGVHPELLGYTMVAEPVVTEQYDELVIPLEPFAAVAGRGRSQASRRRQTTQRKGGEASPKKPDTASAEAKLHHLMAASSSLEGHLRATLRRQLSLMCGDSPSQSFHALPPLSNSEAQALGHPGGISCWPHVLDYGNGIERDTSYTAAYLASIATSAEMEGWLSQALGARRAALFGSPAAPCAWVTTADDAEEPQPQPQRDGEAAGGCKAEGEGCDGVANRLPGRVAIPSLIPNPTTTGTWLTALEYDMASALLRLAAGASVVTAHDVFFHVVLPRADDIGAAVWCNLHEGTHAALTRASAVGAFPSDATGAAALKAEPAFGCTSEVQQEAKKGADVRMEQAYADEERDGNEMLSVSSATALSRGYPLCSLRPSDTGIAALRNVLCANKGSGSASATHHPSQEALMASLLRDGQSRGSFGHDSDVAQLMTWKAALEDAIDTMRVEAARRQATAVMEDL